MLNSKKGKSPKQKGGDRFTSEEPKKTGRKGGRAQTKDNELSEEDMRTLQDNSMMDDNV